MEKSCFNLKQLAFVSETWNTLKSPESSQLKKRTDGRKLKGKLPRNKWATVHNSNTINGECKDSLRYLIYLNNINTQRTNRIQLCRLTLQNEGSRDWGVICLSVRTAIYSTWLPMQPRGLTTTLVGVKPSVEWHGVVATPGERASTRWHQCWAGVQTAARTDDMHATRFVWGREAF